MFLAPVIAASTTKYSFVALENVSDPNGLIGEKQLECLHADLAQLDKTAPVAVFAHRPLFDLYPPWDWASKDGAKAIDILTPYQNTTVFFGHINQERHQMTGHIAQHTAQSLIFSFALPGSQPKRPRRLGPSTPIQGSGLHHDHRTCWRSKTHAAPNLANGQYIDNAADCIGCHAGSGVAFGRNAPNITSDVKTAIGDWSIADIQKLLKTGDVRLRCSGLRHESGGSRHLQTQRCVSACHCDLSQKCACDLPQSAAQGGQPSSLKKAPWLTTSQP
ncbi:hypothetical protein F3J24_00245 [Comamonas sp. Tr-654]|uniref:metallophosphoesterase family protein n=1 Tax=Comamonas sp. Tr-654 TaxID=2608341 RepID=UPI0014207CE0|nr:hypothetical protein [Comamonas sp. Tr-654]NIF81943.1 hypothetical protein [Comamonas sp. Tr-654]